MELILVLSVVWAAFGVVGRYIALQKSRPATEGFWLGFLLGPLGVLLEALLPTIAAPKPKRDRVARRAAGGWQPPKEDDPDEAAAFDFLTKRPSKN